MSHYIFTILLIKWKEQVSKWYYLSELKRGILSKEISFELI